jgi:kynurenine formamidase
MWKVQYTFENVDYQFDLSQPLDISIPIRQGSENPNCYYANPPLFQTIRSGDFIGSVALGGSCNYQEITITPHGNGTHTECYGHISADGSTIHQSLQRFYFLAQVITVQPQVQDTDYIIFWENIEPLLLETLPFEALVIRTEPNDTSKKSRNYNQTNPPYLHHRVGLELVKRGYLHLLVDLPSVDREVDGGELLMHRAFWSYPSAIRKDATITEMIYVPDTTPDGVYLLNLQIISLETDASPSKPVLYPLIKK